MKVSAVSNMKQVEVRLPNRIFKADLGDELSIDTANLAQEFIEQPSKYAWWAVLADIAEQELTSIQNKMLLVSEDSERYQELQKRLDNITRSCEVLTQAKEAFSYRKVILMHLVQNPSQAPILGLRYRSHLSNLRALLNA